MGNGGFGRIVGPVIAVIAILGIARVVWPSPDSPPPGTPQQTTTPAPEAAGSLLPDAADLPRADRVLHNPGLSRAVSLIENLVPHRGGLVDTQDVLKLVGNVSAAVECLYERDHLAVAGYQDPDHRYSVGLVIVVSDAVTGDLLGTAGCTLKDVLLGIVGLASAPDGTVPPRPRLSPCFDAIRVQAAGARHTVQDRARRDGRGRRGRNRPAAAATPAPAARIGVRAAGGRGFEHRPCGKARAGGARGAAERQEQRADAGGSGRGGPLAAQARRAALRCGRAADDAALVRRCRKRATCRSGGS